MLNVEGISETVQLLPLRLFTVLYFFRKIVEIERYVLRAAILHECQNYLAGGGGLTFENRRGIFKRSHEKIGDCEQSLTARRKTHWVSKGNV